MDLLTFDVTANGKAVFMKPNNLLTLDNTLDYREICIPVDAIKRIVLEKNDTDGVNIIFINNDKETINPAFVSRVGAATGTVLIDYGLGADSDTFGNDSVALLNAFKTLLGWTL